MAWSREALRILAATGEELATTRSLDGALSLIARTARGLTGARHAVITLVAPNESAVQTVVASDDPTTELESLIGSADFLDLFLRQAKTLEVVRAGDVVPLVRDAAVHELIGRGFLGKAIRLQDELLGALYLLGRDGEEGFGPDDELFLAHLVHQASLTVGNACLFWQALQRAERLRVLSRLGRFISLSASRDAVCTAVAKAATVVLGAPAACVWGLDQSSTDLRVLGAVAGDERVQQALLQAAAIRWPEPRAGAAPWPAVTERAARTFDEAVRAVGKDLAHLTHPIAMGNDVLGVLCVALGDRRQPSPDDSELLDLLADQAAIAIHTAQLLEEAERSRRESAVLAELGRRINASLEIEKILALVAETAKEICAADVVRVALRDPRADTFVFQHCHGTRYQRYDGLRLFPGKGLTGSVVATGEPLQSEDIASDPRTNGDDLWLVRMEGLVAALIVPIRIGRRVEGVIDLGNRSARPFTEHDRRLITNLAEHAAIALGNGRLLAETERRRRTAETLATVARIVSQTLDIHGVARCITDSSRSILDARCAMLFGYRPETADLLRLAVVGEVLPSELEGAIPAWAGTPGVALRERRPYASPDILCEPRITLSPNMLPSLEETDVRAALSVPLLVRGRVIGVLTVRDTAGRVFEDSDVELAQSFADQAALALENARLYSEATAGHDRPARPVPPLA